MTVAPVRVLGDIVGRATIEDWLAARPALSERIAQAGGVIVLFGVDRHTADLLLAIEQAFADAQMRAGDITLPLFVAQTSLHDMKEAGILFGPHRGYTPSPPPRGAFIGYFGIGEGGARFIAGGVDPDARPEDVLARLLG